MAQQIELKLRVLHELLYEVSNFPDLITPYTNFVRSLRERYHPVGVKDIRQAQLNSGLQCYVDLGDRLGADIYYSYYQEYFDSQLLLSLIHPGATVLDIGANFGYYSLIAATKLTETGTVIAFEPNPSAYELLQENITLNHLNNIIQAHQICLGGVEGETDFYLTEESSFSGIGATGRAKIKEKITIPIYPLDAFLSKLEIPSVDVVKIDVEGYEFAVLAGALQTLANSPDCVIMLEVSAKNLNQERRDALIKVLDALYTQGMSGWLISAEGLTSLKNPLRIDKIGAVNLFLTYTDSPRTQELQDNYQELRRCAFQGIAPELLLSPEKLLDRNLKDPLGYAQLHSALLNTCLRDRHSTITAQQEEISQLKNQISRLEAQKQYLETSSLSSLILRKIKQKLS